MELFSELSTINEKELAIIKQKVGVDGLENGDTNSKYLHSRLRWKRTRNELTSLEVDGIWIDDPQILKRHVKNYMANRFVVWHGGELNLDGIQFKKITKYDKEQLFKRFIEQEMVEAVGKCGSLKSPRSNGFNFSFIKSNRVVIGIDFTKAIISFDKSGLISRGCNASFISLVSKKDNPSILNDFRPISLVGCTYKVVSKILANRLRIVLPRVIDVHQSVFLRGRRLLDSVLVANEVVDFMRKEKKSGLLVKVDFEKAYNSVHWKYLVYMMSRLDFCSKWIKWIKACLESTSISILLNDNPTEEFIPRRGLRQGDLLVPLSFFYSN